MGIAEKDIELATAHAVIAQEPSAVAPEAAISLAVPAGDSAPPPDGEIAVVTADGEI